MTCVEDSHKSLNSFRTKYDFKVYDLSGVYQNFSHSQCFVLQEQCWLATYVYITPQYRKRSQLGRYQSDGDDLFQHCEGKIVVSSLQWTQRWCMISWGLVKKMLMDLRIVMLCSLLTRTKWILPGRISSYLQQLQGFLTMNTDSIARRLSC